MKRETNAKPFKKSPIPKRPVKASYEEPMRPVKPHSTGNKGKFQDQPKRKK
jgi:hypothetical protein